MEKRKLGNSGFEVAPLMFGGNVFGWTVDEARSFQLLDAFVDAGFDFIDTADVYSKWAPGNQGGESETIIGRWLRRTKKRSRVIIATKVASEMAPGKKGLSRRHILEAVEDSLRRLQTDHVDLYQAHVDDTATPLEETLEAFTRLVREGKVRAIGASNYSGTRLAQALESSAKNRYARYETLQPLYNLYDRAEYETDLEPLCEEKRLGVIPYYSLASGFLTGKYRSEKDLTGKARAGTVKKYLNARGFRILDALDNVASEYHATPAKVALAWLMLRPSITAPIASATSVEQLNDLIRATELKLDDAAIGLLNRASAFSGEARA